MPLLLLLLLMQDGPFHDLPVHQLPVGFGFNWQPPEMRGPDEPAPKPAQLPPQLGLHLVLEDPESLLFGRCHMRGRLLSHDRCHTIVVVVIPQKLRAI